MPQKIMLVEDDTNLSEIYKARLEAESYQVISAADGEQALALAVKEHPDLIISDVMMPKISGFDMLDILRGTEGIKDTKVIMMTALGQAEDKARADKLGADRYLVKSQVTLEDVVRSVHEVLGDENAATAPITAATPPPQTATTPASTVAAASAPKTPTSQPVQTPTPPQPNPALTVTQIPIASPPEDKAAVSSTPTASAAAAASSVSSATDNTSASEQAAVLSQIQAFVNDQEAGTTQPVQQPKSIPRPSQTPPTSPRPGQDVTNAPVTHDKVLEPPQAPEASLPQFDNSPPTNDNVNLSDPSGISP